MRDSTCLATDFYLPAFQGMAGGRFPAILERTPYDTVDNLLEAVRFEQAPSKRLRLYHQIQKTLSEDVPVIPLYEDVIKMAHCNNLKDLTLNLMRSIYVYPVRLE